MSLFSQAGMTIVYILLFGGSAILGYYLVVTLKARARSRGKGKDAGRS